MNTEAKTSHDALVTNQGSAAGHPIHNFDRSKAKLVADLKTLVADTEKLIREATDSSAEGFAMLRTRFEGKLAETQASIGRARAVVGEKTRYATDVTHAYVRENPWQSAGVLAAAGVIFGFFLGRRSAAFDVDVPIESGHHDGQ